MSEKLERTTLSQSISSVGATHAAGTPLQEKERDSTIPDPVCGQNTPASFASIETQGVPLGSWWWRTSQRSLMGGWVKFSGPWPRSGTMRSGTVYPHQPSAPITGETDCLLWPTPTTNPHRPCEGNVRLLRAKIKAGEITSGEARTMLGGSDPFKAQGAIDADSSSICEPAKPGRIHPAWVEWLMGFPPGWTDLDVSGTQ
jgi:hypothetical protein